MEQNNNIRQLSQEILDKARICLDYEYFVPSQYSFGIWY